MLDVSKILAELETEREALEASKLKRPGRKPPASDEPPPTSGSAAQLAHTGPTRSKLETKREPS